jgi:hypothetical protein
VQIPEKPETPGVLLKTSATFQPILLLQIQVLFLALSLAMTVNCQAQDAKTLPAPGIISSQQTPLNEGDPSQQPDPQRISDYIRRIFQDKNGHLWFGTNGDGVCRYDGKALEYFSIQQGFGGVAVNVWFPIEHSGIYRYDGKSFTNFNRKDGLNSGAIQCFLEDRQGRIWIGSVFGLFRYDGNSIFPVTKKGPWK